MLLSSFTGYFFLLLPPVYKTMVLSHKVPLHFVSPFCRILVIKMKKRRVSPSYAK
jgi:hypothetical protein